MDFKSRILIIDDMTTMRLIVKKNLSFLKYENLIEASDGLKGWEALTQSDPPVSLIISDINMPNMNGLELLKKVREDDRYKSLPFIFLTAEAELSTMTQAVTLGATTYLVKPFDSQKLKEKLDQL